MELLASILFGVVAIITIVHSVFVTKTLTRQLDEERGQREKVMEKFMSKNFSDYQQNRVDLQVETRNPPSDLEEFRGQMRRSGADPDELAKLKETNPADVYE